MKTLTKNLVCGIAAFAIFSGIANFACAQDAATSDDRIVKIGTGLVSSIRDIQVPARVKGFISTIHFEEGDMVEENAVIAQLDTASIDGEMASAEIRYQNALLQADDSTPVDYAEASFQHARKEYEIEFNLGKTGASAQALVDRARLAARQAELQLVRSRAQKEIDAGAVRIEEQAKKAVQQIKDRHSIIAQFAGEIMSIDRKAGESVQEGQTVLRLVDLSQIKVEGKVNSHLFNANELKGKPVKVTLRMARNETVTLDGVVKMIGLDYQPSMGGSSDFVVQAVINNKRVNDEWLLHPGATVAMEIDLK